MKEKESEPIVEALVRVIKDYKDSLLQQYKYTGKLCINLNNRKVGVILRETDTGSIQVLENIQPKVITTHDNWDTLQILSEEDS